MTSIPDAASELLTVAEYLAITAKLYDDMKWELVDGVMVPKASRVQVDQNSVVAMAPGRAIYALTKTRAGFELHPAVHAAQLRCEVTIDDIGLAINERTSYIPDVIVDCGAPDDDDRVARQPIIVVEVLSPPTRAKDLVRKLANYFTVESLEHCLIVDPDSRDVQHHFRSPAGIGLETHTGGTIRLDPPGIAVDLTAFFE